MNIAIVGAGAAGLIAAIIINKSGHSFTLYESQARCGRKLLATGNGRCNITNANIDISHYHGDSAFASYALEMFDNYRLMDFMDEIGVRCTYEGEKVFPYSLQASSVLDMMRLAEGMREICDCEVKRLIPHKNGVGVVTKNGEKIFDKVIVCTGGKASKSLSGGGAYNLLTDLGHTLTKLKPAIVQLKCENTKALTGIKVNANVKLGDREDFGEVLFTSYGLSGPPILQLSRDAVGKTLALDLAPDLSFKDVVDILENKCRIDYLTLENLFTGFLNKKLGVYLLKNCGIAPMTKKASELTSHDIKKIAGKVKCLEFDITDTNGFDNAQVTAGGIKCSEFSMHTMESKKVKGLYAAGEVLDVDGDCGGFNLQWAFSSGYVAAKSALGESLND